MIIFKLPMSKPRQQWLSSLAQDYTTVSSSGFKAGMWLHSSCLDYPLYSASQMSDLGQHEPGSSIQKVSALHEQDQWGAWEWAWSQFRSLLWSKVASEQSSTVCFAIGWEVKTGCRYSDPMDVPRCCSWARVRCEVCSDAGLSKMGLQRVTSLT